LLRTSASITHNHLYTITGLGSLVMLKELRIGSTEIPESVLATLGGLTNLGDAKKTQQIVACCL
jgi:hypothetical protein